ncbi:MAG: hypothetical protein B6U87_02955 [Candidatus Aenigmarchaeota archaeon ex4484_52]|nr:MAG: hypothetical protein B6U87_02955 [Candidatus Aenigmarchaeota archaeon ex4484_52]
MIFNMEKTIIGIIGGTNGLGNWFKYFFEKNKYKLIISGRKTRLTNIDLAKKSDIVIVAVPIHSTIDVIAEILPYLKDNALLMDITSLKINPINEMKKAKKTIGIVGLHPLFGPLITSIENQYIAVNEIRENKLWKKIKKLFLENKAQLIYIDSKEHDRKMALMQALLHFMNLCYTKTLFNNNLNIEGKFSTPVFRLQSIIIGRILGQNPYLYADLQMQNPMFDEILNSFVNVINKNKKIIETKNKKKFVEEFNDLKNQMQNFIKTSEIKTSSILDDMEKTKEQISFSFQKTPKTTSEIIEKIGYLGPSGTHTHFAATKIFKNKSLLPVNTIGEIFEKIANHQLDSAIIPAENSTNGIVYETYDNLVNTNICVLTSFRQIIHHNLIARCKNINSIKKIVSHPQAIAQTRIWLKQKIPSAKIIFTSSTTNAIQKYKDKSVAFIGSKIAAKEYNLNILKENIENSKNNTTEFYAIAEDGTPAEYFTQTKTLMAVTIYNRVGVLKDFLSVFSKYSINLTKLFSRPSQVKQWDYYFFIEAQIKPNNKIINKIQEELKKYCPLVKILGGT